ncbi:MAG: glutaredoxin family protein [Lysinibacillus sp.]
MMKKVHYYSRPNCHLCEEGLLTMQLVKEDIDFELVIINIETNDELHEKYMLMIPVVEVDNEIVQYGQIDYATIFEKMM